MSQSRGRWIINIVLVLAVIAFVGVSMVPLISNTIQNSQPTNAISPSPSQTQTPAVDEKVQLANQAKGYESVLQREPDNQTALLGLVETRLKLGDGKGAIAPLEKLVASNPTETKYSLALAQIKQGTGDSQGAIVAYRAVLSTKPGEAQALQGLTALFVQQNQPEAALKLLQDTLAAAPAANAKQPDSVDVGFVNLLIGQVYTIQKRYDEAIAIYDQSIKADQQDFRPVLQKALVLKEQGKTAQAKALFDSAAALAPAQYKDQIKQLATPTPSPSASPTVTPEQK